MYHLLGELKRLNNHVLRKISSDELLKAQEEITGSKGYIIGYIAKKTAQGENVYQKDIEKEFSLRRSSATQVLNSLENNGLICRKSEDLDKRLKRIIITEKGENSHKIVINRLNEIDEELISRLTREEFENFKIIIEKLKEGLKVD